MRDSNLGTFVTVEEFLEKAHLTQQISASEFSESFVWMALFEERRYVDLLNLMATQGFDGWMNI